MRRYACKDLKSSEKTRVNIVTLSSSVTINALRSHQPAPAAQKKILCAACRDMTTFALKGLPSLLRTCPHPAIRHFYRAPQSGYSKLILLGLTRAIHRNICRGVVTTTLPAAMDSDDTTPPNATLSEKRLPEEARADGILPPEKRQKMDEGNHEEVKAASSSQTQGKAGESSKAGEAHPSRRGKYKITTRREAKEKKKGETLLKKRRGTRPEGEPAPDEGDKGPRLPKRASALLIGFCGAGYSGMQMCVRLPSYDENCLKHHCDSQKDVRTIEGTLFEALVKAGAVSKDNADDPVKVSTHQACLLSRR